MAMGFHTPRRTTTISKATCLILLILPYLVVSSSLNYNAYHYDMTTPMFTPDGRLLQVEYASLASTHSSPLLVFPIRSSSSAEPYATILMVCNKRHGQDRLVELGESSSRGSAVVVGMSGVLSDSVALLQKVLEDQERRFRMYGGDDMSITVQDVATAIGNACQLHAFGGGIRPYGSIMLVCGLEQKSKLAVAITDPSGAVRALDNSDKKDMVFVGGNRSIQDRIKREIEKRMLAKERGEGDQLHSKLQNALRAAASALLKERADAIKSQKVKGGSPDSDDTDSSGIEDAWLEVVVLSPEHGSYRLTDPQVKALIRETLDTAV